MQQSMWMALLGATLTVLMSTALYGNTLYFLLNSAPGHPAWTNPYLNIFTFGVSMHSIFNDLGVLLVCGVLKKVKVKALGRISTRVPHKHKNFAVVPIAVVSH
jgi:hypothetical protein